MAWGYLRATLVRGADGAPRYALGVLADITSRVEAEEEQARLEIMLHQSQKLEGIGRLAGGIAHDFNNLLAVILNYAELGAADAEGDVAEAFAEISRAGERAADLTTTLLVFSKQKVAKPVPLGVNDLVDEMENFLLRTIGDDVELSTSLDPKAPVVLCDKVQLEQALMNIAVNASDAMPRGGRLLIETRSVDLGGRRAARCAGTRLRALRRDTRDRHRHRHAARDPRARLRALLHDKGSSARHGPRTCDGLRHREGGGRDRPGRVRARGGDHGPHAVPTQRRRGERRGRTGGRAHACPAAP